MELCTKATDLFHDWNDSQILYCHWKSNEHLKEGLSGETDLDVLVDVKDKTKAEALLKKNGYMRCIPQYGSVFALVEDWIGYDSRQGKLLHIHLHYRIITGHKGYKEYQLPWEEEVLKTRIYQKEYGVYISSPDYEIVTLYTRFVLKAMREKIRSAKKGTFRLSDGDVREVAYLKQSVVWKNVEDILKKYYSTQADKIIAVMQKDTLTSQDFLSLHKMIAKEKVFAEQSESKMALEKMWFILRLRTYGKKHFGLMLITRKTPESGKGKMIAFIGQDGAGKSTVTKDIYQWLDWKMDVKWFYLGTGDNRNSWRKKTAKKLFRTGNAFAKYIAVLLTISDCASAAKATEKIIRKARQYTEKGGIALFDRYPQNTYMGINDAPKIREIFMKKIHNPLLKKFLSLYAVKEEKYIQRAVTVTPDLLFKLILPPEISLQRKPEERIETITQKCEIIKNLTFPNCETYTIDATMNYTQELLRIKEHIWDKIQKS